MQHLFLFYFTLGYIVVNSTIVQEYAFSFSVIPSYPLGHSLYSFSYISCNHRSVNTQKYIRMFSFLFLLLISLLWYQEPFKVPCLSTLILIMRRLLPPPPLLLLSTPASNLLAHFTSILVKALPLLLLPHHLQGTTTNHGVDPFGWP